MQSADEVYWYYNAELLQLDNSRLELRVEVVNSDNPDEATNSFLVYMSTYPAEGGIRLTVIPASLDDLESDEAKRAVMLSNSTYLQDEDTLDLDRIRT